MKRGRRFKIGILGVFLIAVGYFCATNSGIPVKLNDVEEVSRVNNSASAGICSWNVSGWFAKGDVICGLVLEPQYKVPGWLQCLEPIGDVPPYGFVDYPHIFVYLKLLDEGGDVVSWVEMLWVNDPNAKSPLNLHLYVYNMTYIFGGSSESYFPVEVVWGTSWIVLTPEGAPHNGTYTLSVSAFGAISPPSDNPPTVIALGKRKIGYPYTYLLPLGIVLICGGLFANFVALFPYIVERKNVRRIKLKSAVKEKNG